MCIGNQPGDITGAVTNKVNPRPTSVLWSFAATNCDDGTSYFLTNVLTGIGPWTNVWSLGGQTFPQVVGSAGQAGPLTNSLLVTPTNSFGANTVSNNIYYISGLFNGNTCSGNLPVDLVGTNIITVNPRPTASLLSFISTNCNDGSPYTLTNTLTGLGPWYVYWNDGTKQTNSTSGSGPVTLARTVYPTNAFAANAVSNNVYFVTAVSNADMCIGNQPGDILGTNTLTINPRPTAFVSGNTNFTVDGTNEYVSVLRADLTGFGPWNLKWSDGVSQTWTDPSPAIRTVTNSLSFFVQSFTNYVYQRLKSSGSSTTAPLTNSSAGLPVSIPNPDGTNSYYTNGTLVGILVTPPNVNTNVHLGQWQLYPTNKSYGSGGNKRYWNYFTIQTNVITTGPTNVLISTRFTYSVTNLTDANCVATTNDLSGSATVFLALGATADVSTPGSTNICLNDSVQVVAIFSGTPPWTAFWSDGTTNVVDVTNNPFAKFVTPTAAGLFTYTITNIMDGTRGVSTNITGGIAITVNALPTDVPVSSGDKTNCAGVANPPLTVTTGGALVNWYNVNYNLVAFSTNSFTPSDTEPGVYIYYAAETNSFGCTGTNVAVNLVLLDCLTNQPVISVAGTNVSVSWFGNVKLQSTTNLLTPWLDELTNPFVAQTNLLFPKFGPPPEKFFRLQIP